MASYLMLTQWTKEGIEHVKKSPERLDEAREIARGLNVEIKQFYLLMGHRYDNAVLLEAPDDQAAAKFALTIGSKGNIRTETLRAFTEDEYRRITQSIE